MSGAGEAVTAVEAEDLDVESAVAALRGAAGGTEYEALHDRSRAARHLNYVAANDAAAVAPHAGALVDALRDERDLSAGASAAKFGLLVRSHRILTALVQAFEELYFSDDVDLETTADGVLLAPETLALLRSVDEEYHDRYAVLHSFNQAAAADPEAALDVAPYMERQLERPPASTRRFQETIRYWASVAGDPDTAPALSPVLEDLHAIVDTATTDAATDCTPKHRFYATIALRRYAYNADAGLERDRQRLVDLVDALRDDADVVRFPNFDYPTATANLLGAVTHDLWNAEDGTAADAIRLFEVLEDVDVVDEPGHAAQLLNGIDAVASASPTAVADVVPALSPYLTADVERVQNQAFHVVKSATPALIDAVVEVAPDVLDAGLASSSEETRRLAALVVLNLAQDAPEAISEYADRIQRFTETSDGDTRFVLFNAFSELRTYLDDELSILTDERDSVDFDASDPPFADAMTQFSELVEDEAGQTTHQVRVDELVEASAAAEHVESIDDDEVVDRILPALTSDDTDEHRRAVSFVNTLAMEDQERYWQHVDAICDSLGDQPPAVRKALLVSLGAALTFTDVDPPDRVLSLDLAFLGSTLDDHVGLLEFVEGVTARDYDAASEYVLSNATAFEAMLTHDRPFVRARSASVVGRMIRPAPAVGARFADTFAANVTDSTPFVRDVSLTNLRDVAETTPDAVTDHVPALVDRLDDVDASCRYHALDALNALASDAAVDADVDEHLEVDRVAASLADTSSRVRAQATRYLAYRALEDPAAVVDALDALRAQLADDAEDVRTVAAIALLPYTMADAPVEFDAPVERLLSMLEDGTDERRFFALGPLAGAYGDDPESLLDRLDADDVRAGYEWSRAQHAEDPDDVIAATLHDVAVALFVLAVTVDDVAVDRDVREALAADARDRLADATDDTLAPESLLEAATAAIDDLVRTHTTSVDTTPLESSLHALTDADDSSETPADAATDGSDDDDATTESSDDGDGVPAESSHDGDNGEAQEASDAPDDGFVVGLTKQHLPRDHPSIRDATDDSDDGNGTGEDASGTDEDASGTDEDASGTGEDASGTDEDASSEGDGAGTRAGPPALDASVLGEAVREEDGAARHLPLAALTEVADRRPDAVTPYLDAVVDAFGADDHGVWFEALWVCSRLATHESAIPALREHADAIVDELGPRPTGLIAAQTLGRIGYHDPDPLVEHHEAVATMARRVVAVNLAGRLGDDGAGRPSTPDPDAPFDHYPATVAHGLPNLDVDAVTDATELEFLQHSTALRSAVLPLSIVVDRHVDAARDTLHAHLDLFAAASWLPSLAPMAAQSFATLAVAHGDEAAPLLEGFLARLSKPADHHVDTVEAFAKALGATVTDYDADEPLPYDHDALAATCATLLDGSVAITDRTRVEILKAVSLLVDTDPDSVTPHTDALATALDRATDPAHQRLAAQTLARTVVVADSVSTTALSTLLDTLEATDDEHLQVLLSTLLRDVTIKSDAYDDDLRSTLAASPHLLLDALAADASDATRTLLDCIGALAENGYRDAFAPHWQTIFEQIAHDDPDVGVAALRATAVLGSPRDPRPVVDHLDAIADTLDHARTDAVDDATTKHVVLSLGTLLDPLSRVSPTTLAPHTDAIAALLPASDDDDRARKTLQTLLTRVLEADPDEVPAGLVDALVSFAAGRDDDVGRYAVKLLNDVLQSDDRHDAAIVDGVVPALADWTDGRLAAATLLCGEAVTSTPATAATHLDTFAALADHDAPTVRVQALRVLATHATHDPENTLAYDDVLAAHLDDLEESRLTLQSSDHPVTPSYEALRGLAALADHAPDAVIEHAPSVVARFDAPAAPTRRSAVETLAALARETPAVATRHRDALVARLTDSDPGTERHALDTYKSACTDPAFSPTSDDLLAILDPPTPDANDAARVTVAATALEHVAHDALEDPDAVRAALRERATSADVDVTFPAIDALLTIDTPTAV